MNTKKTTSKATPESTTTEAGKLLAIDTIGGELVFWRARRTPVSALRYACGLAGVKRNWQEINAAEALEIVLGEQYFRQRGVIIRKTKPGKTGPRMVVVAEQEAEDGNEYQPAGQQQLWEIDAEDWEIESPQGDAVRHSAARLRGMVRGMGVSNGFTAIILAECAFRLREKGGVYFVPKSKLARFHEIVKAFVDAGVNIEVSRVTCPIDANTAEAVASNTADDLRARYTKVIESIEEIEPAIAETANAGSGRREQAAAQRTRERLEKRRAELLAELDAIKADAALIDASFGTLTSLSATINSEIDSHAALLVLTTATN